VELVQKITPSDEIALGWGTHGLQYDCHDANPDAPNTTIVPLVLTIPARHSARSETAGSSRVARRAGTQLSGRSCPGPGLPVPATDGDCRRLWVLLSPLRQRFVLFLLGQFQMLFAEEAEARPLRAVLAAGIPASHVPLQAAELAGNTIAARATTGGEGSRNAIRENLREAFGQGIERVRRASRHKLIYAQSAQIAQQGCDQPSTCAVRVISPILPLWKSRIAWINSSSLFITNGP